MRLKIVVLILLTALVGCSKKPSDIRQCLGRQLTPKECRQWGIAKDDTEQKPLEMVGSAQLLPCEEVLVDGIRYRLAFDEGKRVVFIATFDPKFVTPEAIHVGTTYEEVTKAAKTNVIRDPGWAFYVPLACGWNAAFTQGEAMTEGDLSPDAKIDFFFVRP